jgi:hypothetical protein
MTRGRRPERTLKRAWEIAEKRGTTEKYRHGPGTICHFTIYVPGCLAQVRIKRVRHLRCSLQWLEREAEAELAGLRLIASSREISRELWICAPNSNFRFFRVCDTGLVELDRDGRPLPALSLVPGPLCPVVDARVRKTSAVKTGADPVSGLSSSVTVPAPVAPSETPPSGDLKGG